MTRRTRSGRRLSAPGLVVLTAVLSLGAAGCSGPAPEAEAAYEPSVVTEADGDNAAQVVFTEKAADRVGLQTAGAQQSGTQTVLPYASLIYDPEGATWVYVSDPDLTFVRAQVVVDRIEGDQVFLSDGVPPGTQVVTVGAAEVYGTELGIAGDH